MTQSTSTRIRAVMAHVRRVNELTPHLTRVTLHSPAFAELSYLAGDQYLRLLLPTPNQAEPRLPLTDRWWPDMLAMPAAERPILRNYTVADLRPGAAEMDIDFVRHGDAGPATRWVNPATTGDAVGVIERLLLADAVRDWRPSHDRVVAWVAGEQSMVKSVRRILVRAGLPKADICFHGYFKFGSAQY